MLSYKNKFHKEWYSCFLLVILLIFAFYAPFSFSAKVSNKVDETDRIDEIIVTSTKRSQSLQNVSVSVAAFQEKDLSVQGISDFSELVSGVQGATMQEGGPGYRTVFIRGVASENGNSPTTGVYIDESFMPPGGFIQNIIEPVYFDVARVEILRGPQGTLFGGGSMGGTLRVINNQPDTSKAVAAFGGELSETQGGGFGFDTNMMVNIPLVENKIALRIVGAHREKDGFIDKVISDFSTANSSRINNINDETFTAVRSALKWTVSDNLEITPSVLYQKSRSDNLGAADIPPKKLAVYRKVDVEEPVIDEFLLGNLLVTYDFENHQLLSSSSYSTRDNFFQEDGSDFTAESFLQLPFYVKTAITGDGTSDLLTQELRISTTGNQRLQFVAGIYYDKFSREGGLLWVIPGAEATFPFFAALFPNDVAFESFETLDRENLSLFGEATYRVNNKLRATIGLRWFDYKIETATSVRGQGGEKLSTKEDGINPKVTLSYDITDDHLIYTTVSQGFRPGGPNRVVPDIFRNACIQEYRDAGLSISDDGQIRAYESDQLWNYEIGSKNNFNDKVTINTAAYHIDWSDIQQTYSSVCGVGSTQNFGKAEIFGVELDFTAKLTNRLSFFGGFNFNDSKLAEDIELTGLKKGLKIQSSPEWSASLNGKYDFDLPVGSAYFLISYRYIDKSFRDFKQDDTPLNRRRFQEAYSTVGARLGIENNGWRMALFVDNLTDKAPVMTSYLSTFGRLPSRDRYFTLRPRTFGISFRRDF